MSDQLLTVTRTQLASFIKDPRTLRAFEQSVRQSNDLLPAQIDVIMSLLSENYAEAANGSAKADEALDVLHAIAASLDYIASAPRTTQSADRNDFVFTEPRVQDVGQYQPPLTPENTGADPAGTASKSMASHISASNPHTQYGLKASALSQFTGSLLPAADYTAVVSTNAWVGGTFYTIFAPGTLTAGFYFITVSWTHTGGNPFIVTGCFTASVCGTNPGSAAADNSMAILTSSHLGGGSVISARMLASPSSSSGLQLTLSTVVAGNITVNAYKLA